MTAFYIQNMGSIPPSGLQTRGTAAGSVVYLECLFAADA